MPEHPQPSPRTGPSRDMFGGPWLGVIAFVVIAIGLGWGVAWFFGQAQQVANDLQAGLGDTTTADGFDPDVVFTLKRDLLLGYTANGTVTLFPGRDDLPKHAYGRRSMPTTQTVRGWSAEERKQRDLIDVVGRSTRVRFTEVVEDPSNPQTRILVMVQILDGPHAKKTPVLGMHLESADTDEEAGKTRYAPRDELFEPVEPDAGPVQSPAPQPSPSGTGILPVIQLPMT